MSSRAGPQQGRQFARRGAAHEIHLEEAILGMDVAQGAGGVPAAGGHDVGHAQLVPGNGYRPVQVGQGALPLQPGQAAAQGQKPRCAENQQQDQQDSQDPGHQANGTGFKDGADAHGGSPGEGEEGPPCPGFNAEGPARARGLTPGIMPRAPEPSRPGV